MSADNIPDVTARLALLREPFQAHQISKLPKPFKRDAVKGKCNECGGYHGLPAVHLDYVGHAALTDRLLDVDSAWGWEPVADPAGLGLPVADGGMWIRLTVCGVTRFGFGCADGKSGGDAVKEIIGDALRNAAMRFGAALDLWHKGQLHDDDGDEAPQKPAAAPPAAQQSRPAAAPPQRQPPAVREAAPRPGDLRVTNAKVAKEGSNAKGPWTLYAVKLSDGREGTTFSKSLFLAAEEACQTGCPVEATIDGKNLTALEPVFQMESEGAPF